MPIGTILSSARAMVLSRIDYRLDIIRRVQEKLDANEETGGPASLLYLIKSSDEVSRLTRWKRVLGG
jgi:hypothetical protein